MQVNLLNYTQLSSRSVGLHCADSLSLSAVILSVNKPPPLSQVRLGLVLALSGAVVS